MTKFNCEDLISFLWFQKSNFTVSYISPKVLRQLKAVAAYDLFLNGLRLILNENLKCAMLIYAHNYDKENWTQYYNIPQIHLSS